MPVSKTKKHSKAFSWCFARLCILSLWAGAKRPNTNK